MKQAFKKYKLGLKIFSTNTEAYFEETNRLYKEGLCDYVEIYVVPDSLNTLTKWETLDIPFTIHAPHEGHGFNLALPEMREYNLKLYHQAKYFADRLDADFIIFHGGNRGAIESTASQLASFDEPRAIIENVPYHSIKDDKRYYGATPDEIKFIKESTGCKFCLDIGHALCSANSQGFEPYSYIESFLDLEPVMFHLSGIKDISSPVDSHLNLSDGQLDLTRIKNILPTQAKVSLETTKKSEDNLNDFEEDVKWMRSL